MFCLVAFEKLTGMEMYKTDVRENNKNVLQYIWEKKWHEEKW